MESLLDKSGKLADSAALLAQNLLGVGSANDNLVDSYTFKSPMIFRPGTYLSAGMGHSDIAARITLLGEFAGEKIVELCAENTVGDKFSSLADLGRHFREDWIYGR